MMMQVHYYYHYLVRLWYIGIFFSWICYLCYPIFGWVLDSLIPQPLSKPNAPNLNAPDSTHL